ncbi:hypothetical protein BOTNAR_0629g00030 [Botryotinia narcissicola]|uniref:Uncharacterized protein n=1 Tax=Botryotinia narcissicola TaxID=278944 RepID=A0A4Z1H9U4_9HELO|nr:hypothetical protein BOTNAR_0629g00030 [Botryotinia narcissicola]
MQGTKNNHSKFRKIKWQNINGVLLSAHDDDDDDDDRKQDEFHLYILAPLLGKIHAEAGGAIYNLCSWYLENIFFQLTYIYVLH